MSDDSSLDGCLDPDVLQSLRELGGADDPEIFNELINLFLEDTPVRLRDLSSALEANDATALGQAAHALKSSSANLGATQLSGLFSQIEQAGYQGDLNTAAPLVEQSQSEYGRVEAALKAELS